MSDSKNRFTLLPRSARALSVDTASLVLTSNQLKRLETIYEKKLRHDKDNDSGNESAGEIESLEAFFLTPVTRQKISSLAPSSVESIVPETALPRRASLQDIKILVENKPKNGLSRIESSPCIVKLKTRTEKIELPNRTINKRTGLLSDDKVKKIGPELAKFKQIRARDAKILKPLLSRSTSSVEKVIPKAVSNLEDVVQKAQPTVSSIQKETIMRTNSNDTVKEKKLFIAPKKNETFGKFLKRRLSGGSSQDNIIAPISH